MHEALHPHTGKRIHTSVSVSPNRRMRGLLKHLRCRNTDWRAYGIEFERMLLSSKLNGNGLLVRCFYFEYSVL